VVPGPKVQSQPKVICMKGFFSAKIHQGLESIVTYEEIGIR